MSEHCGGLFKSPSGPHDFRPLVSAGVMFGSLCPFKRSGLGGSEGSLMESGVCVTLGRTE